MPNPPAPNQIPEPSAMTRRLASRLTSCARLLTPTAPAIPEKEDVVELEFERFSTRADEAFALIASMKKIFGTDDPKVLGDKMAGLMAVEAQLGDLLPEAVGAAAADEQTEEQMAQADVGAALAAMSMTAEDPRYGALKEAMMLQRTGNVAPVPPPTKEQLAVDPTLFTKYMTGVRQRRAGRTERRNSFRAKYGIDKMIPVPAHLQHVYGQFFAGPHAAFNATNAGAPPAQFGAHGTQPGTPPTGTPPAAPPGALTWARVAQLPPNPRGDNPGQRIYDDLVRTEFGGKEPRDNMTRAQLWTRVRSLLADLTAREGDGSNYFRAA